MNTIKFLTFVCLLISLASCDGMLDMNPKGEVVNDDMFKTAKGCEDAIYGLYGELGLAELYGECLSWALPEVLSQNFRVSNGAYEKFKEYDYKNAAETIETLWAKAYLVIGHANNVIANMEAKDPGSFPLYDVYLGEAYGIRAMLHFEILRYFTPRYEGNSGKRGIPYVKEYSYKHTPFSTVGECYDKIVTDLQKAQALLKGDETYMVYPRKNVALIKESFLKDRESHFNYYAATALLARVYWTKNDLPRAAAEAQKIIDSRKFPLSGKDEVQNLIAGVLSPKESIFGIYSTDYFTYTKADLYDSGSSSMTPYNENVGYMYPYTLIYNKYVGTNAGLDARLNWFRSVGASGSFKNCLKVVDEYRIRNQTTPAERKLLEGISVLRSPEMYYIVSEAKLLAGDTGGAESYMDSVLLSRGLTALSVRQPVLTISEDLIYNERHKEFFGEGQRWFDMKKRNMGIESNVLSDILEASDTYYVLPIPASEFEYRTDN